MSAKPSISSGCASGSRALIGELRRLDAEERYRPNSQADCYFCDFKTLCSLYPQGAPMFPTDGGS